MATLQQIKQGIGDAWSNVVEGWRRLTERASNALTRFYPGGRQQGKDEEKNLAEIRSRSIGWGLLAAEVFDDDRRVVVRLEAPGMRKEDFNIQVINDYLVIRGRKKVEREASHGNYHIVECAYGSFERAIPLPCAVDREHAKATYRRGVLKIELPKPEKTAGRPIPVNVS